MPVGQIQNFEKKGDSVIMFIGGSSWVELYGPAFIQQ